jgi:hypothetical protein
MSAVRGLLRDIVERRLGRSPSGLLAGAPSPSTSGASEPVPAPVPAPKAPASPRGRHAQAPRPTPAPGQIHNPFAQRYAKKVTATTP